jgi:hypothetical protein
MSLVCKSDENEIVHSHCDDCGYDSDMEAANERAELERETPLGEQIDGGNDEFCGMEGDDDCFQTEGDGCLGDEND